MKTLIRSLLVVLAVAGFAACGDDDQTVSSADDAPAAGSDDVASMCIEGSTDCDDTPTATDGGDPDAVDEGAIIEEGRALLGVAQDQLSDDVRIARAGDVQFALTEDYVIGRMTVELDPDEDGTMRVVTVVIELTDGPLTLPEE